jgi:hypothetical protein
MLMSGETDLAKMLRTLTPVRQPGTYVFCTVASLHGLDVSESVGQFREPEGITLILPRATADRLQLPYSYEAAWLMLMVHSSLEAVGLTAAFAQALATAQISCNVVAGYYHDHLFVATRDADKALETLRRLAAASS